jgi:hypothetical protein
LKRYNLGEIKMINIVDGTLPHIYWIDIKGDSVMVEVAVMNKQSIGDGPVSYIQLDMLDQVDKSRLAKLVKSRDADKYELWDLMANSTLGNGMNALDYFHQLVKVITPEGVIMRPSLSRRGVSMEVLSDPISEVEELAEKQLEEAKEAVVAAKSAKVTRKARAGRKPRAKKTTPKTGE